MPNNNSTILVLKKAAAKILLAPGVKQLFDKLTIFYYQQVDSKRAQENSYAQIIRTINVDKIDIGTDITEQEAKALEELVKRAQNEDILIVEVGPWKGFTTSIMAKTILDTKGYVFPIDHWMGGEGTEKNEAAKIEDVFNTFKHNMITLGVWDKVNPLFMDSLTAATIFQDNILDLVFIDGDHRYKAVKDDIIAWFPKLKQGGIICGHDCNGYYSKFSLESKQLIDNHLGDNYIESLQCHPGVTKALFEMFNDKYSIMPSTNIWYVIKQDPN